MKNRIKTMLFVLLMGLTYTMYAQEKQVSGTIKDANDGVPLPGASVSVKGTSKGVSSDFDGNFTVSVGENDIIIISYVGYVSQEIAVAGKQTFNIQLQSDQDALEEVVVVAYGTQKKETITSSVVEVKADKLTDVTVPDVVTMLQGKVSGVQVLPSGGSPGSSPNIIIRGRSSINSTNSPLWVVDGVIVGNSDPKINPRDIEGMSILKDASATALYGNRGANGVILITTRRGEIGKKPQMTVYLKSAINQFNPGKFEVMNSQQLYEFHESLGNTNPWFDESLLERDFDWIGATTQDAFVKDATVSFTSATETHNMLISGGYYNEQGTVIGSELDRYTYRTNLDYNISEKLTIKPKLYFVFDRRENSRGGDLYQAYTNMPWDNPFNEDGSVVNANQSLGDDWIGRDKSNYFYDRQWNYSDSRSFDLFASFDVEYKLLKNLTFISANNFRWGNSESFNYTDPRSNGGRSTNGSIQDNTFRGLYRFTNQMLKYSNTFNEDHTVNALAAYEYNDTSTRNVTARSENIVVNGQVQSVGLKPAVTDGNASETAQQSFLVAADYDYKSKYFAKASLRIDGASAFAPDYRYGEFYSVAAGWNIHKEDFFNIDDINVLKLRASYGAVGNQPGGFGYLSTYDVRFQYAGLIAAKPNRLGTKDLTWEKGVESNFGIDATFFDAIDLTVDYYNKENSGLLFYRRLSDQTGFSGRYQNIGSVTNKGLEIAIAADIVKTENFGIAAAANISFNKNNVKELPDGTDIIGGSFIIREGEEFGTFYMRKWLGVNPADGAPVYEIINPDTGESSTTSNYNNATLQTSGSANPDYTGGFGTLIWFKNFTLTSNWVFSYGAELYNASRNLFDSDGYYLQYNQMVLPDGWSRWERPGDVATHPKPQPGGYAGSNQTSTRYLEDGSYLRLANVTLSYDLPKSIMDKVGLSSANITLSGDNLLTFTKFTGVDPTISNGIGGSDLGYTSIGYPVPRRFALGLNLGF